MEPRQIMLSNEQMQQAANAGVTLLNTPGVVAVPGPMAVSGIVGTLNSLLMAIASGEAVVMNVPIEQKENDKTPPEGDGDKKPDLKPVDTGKQAEK